MAGCTQKEMPWGTNPLILTLVFMLPVLLISTVLFGLLIAWEQKKFAEDQTAELKEVARAFYEQIIITRIWNAQHGGVYVEVSDETPPNPYLEDPQRDIVSVGGKHYTKINPAYMTRQLSEIAGKRAGYKFRIVGINPVNPYNTADEWEAASLRSFERGEATEAINTTSDVDGHRIFRYLVPLRIEESCLKCHARHGYSLGNIKGGVDVMIPIEGYETRHEGQLRRIVFSLVTMGLSSIIFIGLITYCLSMRLSSKIISDFHRQRLEAVVELSGAAAHEMRQPMTIILSLISMLKDKKMDQEPISEEEMDIINDQCKRLDNIIKKMLNITSYTTKDYLKDSKILDLDESSKN